MYSHGNEGYRVKNLRYTSGCPHYRALSASALSATKCATNGCDKRAIRACHVISANQTAATGMRKIVYMCASCNGLYDMILEIRSNAITYELPDCRCGSD